MPANPGLEELTQKIERLEQENLVLKKKLKETHNQKEKFQTNTDKAVDSIICKDLNRKHTNDQLSSSLMENSPDAIIVYNPDSSVRYVNPAFEKITGYSSEEALGTKMPYPWWIDDPEYGTVEERGKLGLRGLYRTERRYRKKNGDYFYVELYVTPIYHNGELNYSFSTWTDINERKKAELELKKSLLIINSTSDGIITTDTKGNILFVNSGAERIYGYRKEELTGKPISQITKKEELHVLEDIASQLLKGKDIPVLEGTGRDKKGKDVNVLVALTTLKDEYGHIKEFVSVIKDISERKEMEDALKKAHHELEERVRERTQELKKANEALYEKTVNLQEVNTALKVLLEKRDRDNEENGEKVLFNVKELLIPYVSKLKNGPLTESQSNYLDLLESGLQDIISPFAQKLTSRYMHITPRELQVANLVKEGKTSKEIAEVFKCTERTIVAHRANLRKKFGLKKKSNLRTYLLSLQ